MCDNQDTDLPKALKRINLKHEFCKKCQGENGRAAILLRNDDKPLCKECFLSASIHKFRSEFGKSQLIRQGEKVLVGFSGGQSSKALFEMIRIGLSESAFRKLRFIPEFIHIRENNSDTSGIKSYFSKYKFDYRIIDENDLVDTRLKDINESLKTSKENATSKKAAKSIILKEILANYALENGFKRVLVATNCSRLAIKTLSNLSQGAHSISDNVEFHDTRFSVSIIQPMRNFSVKEIAFLNLFCCETDFGFINNEESRQNSTYSIDRLSEHFISSLSSDFPSTILTINRTAEKTKTEHSGDDSKICQFCKNSYKDTGAFQVDVASASNAMTVAMALLEPGVTVASMQQNPSKYNSNHQYLCYSCRWIQNEVSISLTD